MRNIRFWVIAALLALPVFAQTPVQVGDWPNDTAPTGFVRVLVDEGCPTANPCVTGTTSNLTGIQLWSFSNQLSGTLLGQTLVIGTGSSLAPGATGTISANQANGLAIPVNATVAGTNSSGGIIPITPTGCIGAGSNQIYNVCVQLPSYTIGGTLPACNAVAPPTGTLYTAAAVTNGAAVPVYLAPVSTTGPTVAPVFCNGTNWVYH